MLGRIDDIKIRKNKFVQKLENPVHQRQQLSDKPIGSGSMGCQLKATLRDNPEIVRLCKIVPKLRIKDINEFLKEIELLINLDHPNIIRIFEQFEDQKCLYLIIEFINGFSLFDLILTKKQSLTETDMASIFNKMIRALSQLHNNGIVQRDVRPHNFVITEKSNWDVKLMDFGNVKTKHNEKSAPVGVNFQLAPESQEGEFTPDSDVWSCGVILYTMIAGYPPFFGNTADEIKEEVKRGRINFEGEEWARVDPKARNLISSILNVDPAKRLKSSEILNNEWLLLNQEKNKLKDQLKQIKEQAEFNKFKKIVQAQMAMISNDDKEIQDLKQHFYQLDKNGDGILEKEEVVLGVREMGISDEAEILKLIEAIDIDGNGQIEQTEFLAAMIDHKTQSDNIDKVKQAFSMLDKDSSGFIDPEEILEIIGYENQDILNDIMNLLDDNGDGKISFEEFLHLMCYNFADNNKKYKIEKGIEKGMKGEFSDSTLRK